jgi:dienelactone hydrolase
MDDRLGITIRGLPPGRAIAIRARSRARDQRWWRSAAAFVSEQEGRIDLGAQAPVSGTYRGADAMGLFWSMEPDAHPKQGEHAFFRVADEAVAVITEIEAVSENRVIGSTIIERRFAGQGVRRREVAEDGVVGVLYEPGDGQGHPGIIVIGGSDGGFGEPEDALLASRGFAVLSLAYFGTRGVPPTLQNIPLEYFVRAVQWLRARPGVEPDGITLFGASRGAEAALMVAAVSSGVKAVVAVSPSHARWEGLNANRMPEGPAWTYHGKALPYIPNRIGARFAARYVWDKLAGNPIPTTPLFLENLADSAGVASAEIPVENIQGPVLLLSGDDDQVWPSSSMAERVISRLRQHRRPFRDEHLSYDGAGHWLPRAWVPTRGSWRRMRWAIGGTAQGTARAHADSWPKILAFLAGASSDRKNGR